MFSLHSHVDKHTLRADYEADHDTGKVIYGYISDMCPDKNWWCQADDGHLDISRSYLRSEGLMHNWHGVAPVCWRARALLQMS